MARQDVAPLQAPLPDGTRTSLYRAIHVRVFQPLAAPKLASLLFALAALALMYGVLEVLYRRRWFLKV